MSGEQTGIPLLVKTLVSAIKGLVFLLVVLLLVIGVLIVYIARGG